MMPNEKDNPSTWNLRQEVLRTANRWYFIAVFFLIGGLIGWGVSYIWPSNHRATVDLFVGLNAYRSPYDSYIASVAQQEFRLVDDYKNWQMEQLNELALSDDFLTETLRRLQDLDSFWRGVPRQELREMLRGTWRNVGKWHLAAEGKNPDAVAQAVGIWSDVVNDLVNDAIGHSKNVVALDIYLTELSETKVSLELRHEVLLLSQQELIEAQSMLMALPQDQPVSAQIHWNVMAQVSRAANWEFGWVAVLDDAPGFGSFPTDYSLWLDSVAALIEQEIADLPVELDSLEQRQLETEAQYREETAASRALASTLLVEKSTDAVPKVEPVRSTGVLILVGCMIGLIVWGVWTISQFGLGDQR